MRLAVTIALVVSLAACSPAPSPYPASPSAAQAALTPVPTTTDGSEPVSGPVMFSFDVENRSSIGVIVSVVSDTAATMPGFEPGQYGTVSIKLLNPANGIGVEIQGVGCSPLADASYPTPGGFTLVVEDGAEAGTVRLSTRPEMAAAPIPLPSNSLVGCGG